MEAQEEKRARRLVDILESAGSDCGLLIRQGTVMMHFSGTPFKDSPTMYDEADLNNAIELNLLEKKVLIGSSAGSSEWEWYVVSKKSAK